MNTYTLLTGERLEFEAPDADALAFLDRVRKAVTDSKVNIHQITELVYGIDNPIMNKTLIPGRASVDPSVLVNPVYRIMIDLIDQKKIALGLLDMDKVRACYSIDVPSAAKQLGITVAAVRAAIKARRLPAMFINGQWWTRQEGIDGYKVSNRGPKRKPAVPASQSVQVRMGGKDGCGLSVRVTGGEVVKEGKGWGRIAEGWSSALVRTTTKEAVRVFEIEPGETIELIELGALFVRGPFTVVQKHNNIREAQRVWRDAAPMPSMNSEE